MFGDGEISWETECKRRTVAIRKAVQCHYRSGYVAGYDWIWHNQKSVVPRRAGATARAGGEAAVNDVRGGDQGVVLRVEGVGVGAGGLDVFEVAIVVGAVLEWAV